MSKNSRTIAEISALRFQLLGRSDVMLSATQYACRSYIGILFRMAEGGDSRLGDIREKVAAISEVLNRAALYRNECTQADAVQKCMTDLRMIIDMHLHALGASELV